MAGLTSTINVNLEPTDELRAFIRTIVKQEMAGEVGDLLKQVADRIEAGQSQQEASTPVLVGREDGPELVSPPKGSTILPLDVRKPRKKGVH